jgi:hypothetical protein
VVSDEGLGRVGVGVRMLRMLLVLLLLRQLRVQHLEEEVADGDGRVVLQVKQMLDAWGEGEEGCVQLGTGVWQGVAMDSLIYC